ncbi:5,10-methylenetetrahydrofolate reductase [Povalibacter uvarum]|uniref:Methylenetetrahydrofolate reductase n=1 Tax=Povalibacter uvarum TaxID=732238 RepID=A0A841HW11_9GAMM|nr:methylenetetrahydrofolate reductase [Povalibacter uvarum]MBB6095985.1 5,10-methylenetetrahydrofolate reductase [Povalibacter uvarum]
MLSLSHKLQSSTFTVTTELTPPKGTDLSDLLAKADSLRGYVDGINLTESPRARLAVGPLAVAKVLKDRGHEPIVQFTTRDRNRIALQADILGAAVLGIENMVFMAGDPPANGDHPQAKPVFDLSTIDLLQAARSLKEGRDMAGNELKGRPSLLLGATANPGCPDLQREVENVRRKIDAGAQFLQTQAVYDADALRRFVDALKPDANVLVGIIPLKSSKMANWLNANVPGIAVPEALIAEMDRVAGDAQAELKTSMDICARIVTEVKSHCAGVHLMAMGWEAHIPGILEASGVRR